MGGEEEAWDEKGLKGELRGSPRERGEVSGGARGVREALSGEEETRELESSLELSVHGRHACLRGFVGLLVVGNGLNGQGETPRHTGAY